MLTNNTLKIILPRKAPTIPILPGLQPTAHVWAKAYVYDFKADEIVLARKQEFEFSNSQQTYVPIDELLTTTSMILGDFTKDKKVKSISGPFDTDGNAATQIKLGEPYTFTATPNQTVAEFYLLAIKWAYRLDDGELTFFKNQTEIANGTQAQITVTFPKSFKARTIKVYGFYTSASERVCVEVSVLGAEKETLEIEPKESDIVEPPKKEAKDGCYCNKDLTEQILKDIGVSDKKASEFLDSINKTFTDYQINTCLRKSHFLSQVIHESGGFRYTAELNVVDTAYGGFKGRGLIQLTGETNYKDYGTYEKQDFVSSLKNKIKLEQLPYSVRSAGWFWKEKAKLNDDADINDHIYITRIINGGYNGYNDRLKYLKKGFEKLYNNCINDSGKNIDFDFNKSKAYNDKRGSFAWGLWHDPDLNKKGCTIDKQKAIEGYSRFVDLVGDDYAETNWYNIKNISNFNNLKYTVNKKEFVKVLDAAKQRIKSLKM